MSAQSGRERFSKVICVGAGNIDAGWVAHFLRAGLEVVVYDPVSEREAWLNDYIGRTMPDLARLGLTLGADKSLMLFTTDIEEALDRAEESSPENFDSKAALIGWMTVASSSAGFGIRNALRSTRENLAGHGGILN
ncbi:hypothetical protein HJB67_27480 [Rhizobium lentis]|uniref:3-hydroxyacyl-CoA dehydrogenase NAD-binding domain-containing protein n=1 Tax=Rhizobium lentis TaxID=1138194 RepID=UPI001C8355A7|nr:3-hydroxyacyl-CoA dehydrogenase NAD-binding domain-containing protein [Rhizobium lentis]MBX5013665.1 hypothetical protein [Rhizobium lentis]